MEISDNTINVHFREINSGQCFVWGISYYMKIRTSYYDEYGNKDGYEYLALNLQTGFTEDIKEEKVRLINTKLLVY